MELVNALCHRQYATQNTAITLALFDNRLELWNNGTLPSPLHIEDLKRSHKSYPRNELIAEIFYIRGYIEGWGTGTTKIIKQCKEHGVPEPEFKEYSGGFSIILKFNEAMGTISQKKNLLTEYLLNSRQKEILALIKQHTAITLHSIIKELKDPPSDRMVRKDLDALRKGGFIHLEGHGKSAMWRLALKNEE